MNKRILIFFAVGLIIISSGFAFLGVKTAGYLAAAGKKGAAEVKKPVRTPAKPVSKERKPDYIMTATAYSDTGQTKSQIYAGVGCVAVDRSVIPHGTLLYIEGYGLAVAVDTGRLIKGRIIDVWFADEERALQWGRKKVKVWKVGHADIKKILSTGGKYVKY